MRKLFFLLILFSATTARAQSHEDTLRLLRQTAALYDLDFTNAEADSMIGNIVNWKRAYGRLHEQLPANDIPFPFAFQPAPYGFPIPQGQMVIKWNIPNDVALPADREDLAFYSIVQLASLIKNKKNQFSSAH